MKEELFCMVLMALKVSLSYSDVRQRKAKKAVWPSGCVDLRNPTPEL